MARSVDACGLTPLHYAAASDCAASCRLLMAAGAEVEAVSTRACYDTNLLPCNAGMTPLHIAAMGNGIRAVNAMLLAWVGRGCLCRGRQRGGRRWDSICLSEKE